MSFHEKQLFKVFFQAKQIQLWEITFNNINNLTLFIKFLMDDAIDQCIEKICRKLKLEIRVY